MINEIVDVSGFRTSSQPNRGVPADHDPRERGPRPLNSNR